MNTVAKSQIAGDESRLAAPELSGLRILLVHEWLYTWAGAERCLEQLLLLMPEADLLAGVIAPGFGAHHPVVARARETFIGRMPGARRKHRWFLPLHPLAFRAYDTREYDLVISVSHAFEKTIRARKRGAAHLCYCLTPPRYLWDLSEAHTRMARPVQQVALGLGRPILRALDRHSATGVDRFIAISNAVAARIRTSYGRASAVVYPPVARKVTPDGRDTAPRERFLLSLGRLVPYKRTDLAILAAQRLGMRLLVAGEGPDERRLRALAGRTTEFLGAISEAEAGRLMSRCSAFVFCAEEDFGIAPLEANAHGAPVVAFARGGAGETIRDGETGVLFHEQSADAVMAAIERCLAGAWDREALRANAARFSPERFRSEMRREIGAAVHREITT